ncbi:MAG: protein kinase [Deltaproteobacteria bacterium]|nr:protein kinase [Deltaproteobacteria bacterium]
MAVRGPKRIEAAAKILERLERNDLKDAARDLGVSSAGSKPDLVQRLAPLFDRVITELASAQSSFSRDFWNDIVELSGGERRKSWDDVQEELRLCLEVQSRRADMARLGSNTVNQIRQSDALLAAYSGVFSVTPARFLSAIEPYHGKNLIESVWDEVERDLGGHDYFPASQIAPSRSERPLSSEALAAPLTKPITPPEPGHWLGGRWRIVNELGKGGMGRVYEVVNKRGMQRVAKVAHGNGSETDALVREAELGLELAHENVCRFYDLDDDATHGVFAVMQHCGQSLDRRFRRRAAELDEAIELLSAAAVGIDYLHSKSVIHGDVSPANILVDANGHVRITDFGIASQMRAVTRTGGLTHVGELRGRNAAYAADEVNSGEAPRRGSDQASLAKVFCALLLGTEEFVREKRYTFQRLGPAQAALDTALRVDVQRRHESCTKFMHALLGGAL